MTCSILKIARTMDPLRPPGSVKELARRHRWLMGYPPVPLSLISICSRHNHPQKIGLRFLWYNTFLLEGWTIDLCRIDALELLVDLTGLAEQDIIKQLGVSPADILKQAGIGKYEILNLFNISPQDVANMFSDLFDALCDEFLSGIPVIGDLACSANDLLNDMLEKLTISNLLNEFNITVDMVIDALGAIGISPLDILAMFCDLTFAAISSLVGVNIPKKLTIKAKPELDPRAREIGTRVGAEYDIVALCEAFSIIRRKLIRQHAEAASSKPMGQAEGPDDSGANVLADSGLLTMVFGRAITSSTSKPYDARGDLFRDADAWSNKGVLLTRVDVGLGILEVYSTHLYAGGDLLNVPEWVPIFGKIFPEPTDEEKLAVQREQLEEFKKFYDKHHDYKNVAIIVGDFNMAAHKGDDKNPNPNKEDYPALLEVMNKLNMLDSWPYHRHRQIPSPQDNKVIPRGDTHASNDDNSSSEVWRVCQPAAGSFCDEPSQPEETSRIDYIFIEKPRPEHAYSLDFTRIRRRPFRRPNAVGGQEKYLSDHLGLDVTLIISPR